MPQPEQLQTNLQKLISPEMGYQLQFPNHEDGGELKPFVWDTSQQGEFSPLNLLRALGCFHNLEQASVLNKWLTPEQVGAVNGEAWLLPEADPVKILLDDSAKAARLQLYQALLQRLHNDLQSLQAFELSWASEASETGDSAGDSNYSFALLVGQAAKSWLAVSPNVPHATVIDENAPLRLAPIPAADPEPPTPLQAALEQLHPIQLYGYYSGGYNQIHDYHLIAASDDTLDRAIERALLKAGLLERFQFEGFQPNAEPAQPFEQLAEYLRQHFSDLSVYRFSFWNNEHFYIVGEGSGQNQGNWGGVVLHSRFTYNP
jgi:hypothetical protein